MELLTEGWGYGSSTVIAVTCVAVDAVESEARPRESPE